MDFITIGDGRSNEELLAAANYGSSSSQVIPDNFPARPVTGRMGREVMLITFAHPVSQEEGTFEAAKQSLGGPFYEGPSISGSITPKRSWKGRRDAICLWYNTAHRELDPGL